MEVTICCGDTSVFLAWHKEGVGMIKIRVLILGRYWQSRNETVDAVTNVSRLVGFENYMAGRGAQ